MTGSCVIRTSTGSFAGDGASGVRRPAPESAASQPPAPAPARAPARQFARARIRARFILAAAALLFTAACGDAASETPDPATRTEAAPASKIVVAVVDFSGSQTTFAVRDSRAYLEKVVDGLGYGDRFVLLEMYRTGSRDSVGKFVRDMPATRVAGRETSYDARELAAAKTGVRNALPIFFDPRFVGEIGTTDILTTLHIASEYLRDAGAREKQLVLLTDMLQSTPQFEFEGARRMPGDGWVAAQSRGGLLPDLAGACVVVVGADNTTAPGHRVESFWADYFEAAGARFDAANYRLRAPVDEVGC